jgi:hypothetical protein
VSKERGIVPGIAMHGEALEIVYLYSPDVHSIRQMYITTATIAFTLISSIELSQFNSCLVRAVCSHLRTPRAAQQREPPHDTWSNLVILCLCMAIAPELWCLAQEASAKPRSMALAFMRDDLDLQSTGPRASAPCFTGSDPCVD